MAKPQLKETKREGSENGTGHYGVHRVVTLRGGGVISNKTVDLLERFYFKRPLSMEYAAWLRVMCAGLLLVFIQVAPQFTLLYTLKLVTLINLGIQTMKLNGVYKYKRTGILPPGGALSNLTRLNPFKKKSYAPVRALFIKGISHKLDHCFLPASILRM